MSAAAPEQRSATLAVPGARLALYEIGPSRARPLVVLHSGPGESHHPLRPHLDALASDRRRVVYYDQRGGGASRLTDGAAHAGLLEHVADVERVCAHLGVDRVDVLGFSWGAILALAFARRGRVSRMVLVSPPSLVHDPAAGARITEAARRPAVAQVIADAERAAASGDDAACRRARFVRRVAPVFHDPRVALDLRAVDVDEAARDAATASLRALDLRSLLPERGAVPTLLVVGAEDPITSPSSTAALADALDARQLTLEACGHAPFAEGHDAFVLGVRAFLDAS